MEQLPLKNKIIHLVFRISIAIKGINGLLETLGGIILLFIKSDILVRVVYRIFQNELVHDPDDYLVNHLIDLARAVSIDRKVFWATYLIFHGTVKVMIVIGLWLEKLWAYPIAGIVLIAFIAFQIYEYMHIPSVMFILMTALDLTIIAMAWVEFKRLKSKEIIKG